MTLKLLHSFQRCVEQLLLVAIMRHHGLNSEERREHYMFIITTVLMPYTVHVLNS